MNYLFVTIYGIIIPKINSIINPNLNLQLTAHFTLVFAMIDLQEGQFSPFKLHQVLSGNQREIICTSNCL